MDLLNIINRSGTAIGYNAPRLVVVTAAGSEPVSVAEAKLWCRVDQDADDDIFTELIKAARSVFEQMTGRTLIDTVYRAEWDHLPRVGTYHHAPVSRELELPRAPLKASSPVASVKYLDSDGVEQTMDTADYTVDGGRDPGRYPRIWLNDGSDWPALGSYPGALRVQFTAGYGAAASDVPAEIKAALKLLVTHFYQKRDPVNVGNIVNELPWSLRALVDLHTIRSIA